MFDRRDPKSYGASPCAPHVRAATPATTVASPRAERDHTRGNIIITMDGDLQDNPEDMLMLLAKIDQGNDMVNGWRVQRQDTFTQTRLRLYNATVKLVSGLKLHDMNCA